MLPEEDAFIEYLFQEHGRRLTLYATSVLRDPEKAQDVVQDVFHEAVLHIDVVRNHENTGGWLMKTLKNKLSEYLRARSRYIRLFLSLDTDFRSDSIAAPEPTGVLEARDDISALRKIEQVLTPEELHLLKRLIIDQASHLEVAMELGISVYASQKRLERIRRKLYKAFPERKNRFERN